MYLSPEGLTAVSGSPDLANLTLRGLDSQLISLKRQVGGPGKGGAVRGDSRQVGTLDWGQLRCKGGCVVAKPASSPSSGFLGNLMFFFGH